MGGGWSERHQAALPPMAGTHLVVNLGHRETAWRNPEGRHHTEIRRMGGGGKEPVGERPTPPEAD